MRILVTLLAVAVFLVALSFAGVMGLYAYYARDLPDPGNVSQREAFQTARILDRNGALLEELNPPSGDRRTVIPLAEIPKVLQDATVSAEDATFFDNPGFDPRAILRALYQDIRTGSTESGASTITQQLVKNTLLGPQQTPERKIKETFLAIEVTRRYSKDQILDMYLNEIPFGNQAYGVEAASETYFGKHASELSLAEASLLAGLPQAPALYDPFTNLPAAKARQRYVLDQMVHTNSVTQDEADQAFQTSLQLAAPSGNTPQEAPHFVGYVRQLLEQELGPDALYGDGLQVTTTLDLGMQHAAEAAASNHIDAIRERNATNAAVVSMRPDTGEILAMVGSVDFNDATIDGQANAALALRQPGSTLKPFTYLSAFAKGWNPATLLMDVPTLFQGTYSPLDYDDQFRGPVSAREALAQSLNVPAIQTLEYVGIPDLLATVHRMGISSLKDDPSRYGLSVTLGGGEVSLLDLTFAYSALANEGRLAGNPVDPKVQQPGFRERDPIAILKVVDSSGNLVYQANPSPDGAAQVADPRLVFQVNSILTDDVARAPTYGRNSVLVLPGQQAAVKTGTTDDYRDSWVVGYTPDLVTGVWVGNNNNTPMQDIPGVAGAGQIWHEAMTSDLEGTPAHAFTRPTGVVDADVCALSGLLPTDACQSSEVPVHGLVSDVFVPGVNLPSQQDTLLTEVETCTINGKLSVPAVPANGRETHVFAEFPAQYESWAVSNGYPQAPKETCDDVYKGVHTATITQPVGSQTLVPGVSEQVVGTAEIDDFDHYTLDVRAAQGADIWYSITSQGPHAVDKGALGVWNTQSYSPGPYTVRLRVFDSLDDFQETTSSVILTAPPTATPAPSPTVTLVPQPTVRPPGATAPAGAQAARPGPATATPVPPR